MGINQPITGGHHVVGSEGLKDFLVQQNIRMGPFIFGE